MTENWDHLKLSNQLCFPLYAASRLVTREYKPYLDRLGITYPQYLILMVLWEEKELNVNALSKRLILNTNTLTPLLKRMEKMDLVRRQRSSQDERVVMVSLTPKGLEARKDAARIPLDLTETLISSGMSVDKLVHLKAELEDFISRVQKTKKE